MPWSRTMESDGSRSPKYAHALAIMATSMESLLCSLPWRACRRSGSRCPSARGVPPLRLREDRRATGVRQGRDDGRSSYGRIMQETSIGVVIVMVAS
jgi:hypothetical protein